jgi:hypothetical protein
VVVVHNNVLNGLVIDLFEVDQVVMIIVVNRMDIMVASDLDHHVQKQMNLGNDI